MASRTEVEQTENAAKNRKTMTAAIIAYARATIEWEAAGSVGERPADPRAWRSNPGSLGLATAHRLHKQHAAMGAKVRKAVQR